MGVISVARAGLYCISIIVFIAARQLCCGAGHMQYMYGLSFTNDVFFSF